MNAFKCKEYKKIVTHFEKECSYCGAKKNQFSLVLVSALVIIFILYLMDNLLSY
ncbi:hypothetical protein N9E06_00885 [Candidatus Pelagibacter sp.]|nr:hypothetical protein [Candidatus Pelagibacter sp.]